MSNLDIVSGMVLSILDVTLVLIEVILRNIGKERDSRQQHNRSVSSSLWDTFDDQGKLSYHLQHIHDVAQASLKSGTHFDGHFTYDSKDLWIATCTFNE